MYIFTESNSELANSFIQIRFFLVEDDIVEIAMAMPTRIELVRLSTFLVLITVWSPTALSKKIIPLTTFASKVLRVGKYLILPRICQLKSVFRLCVKFINNIDNNHNNNINHNNDQHEMRHSFYSSAFLHEHLFIGEMCIHILAKIINMYLPWQKEL